ncbi:MAG: undecaprenyl-phosphate galactose phosphotransferase WbaP [Pirellula sp.]|nr:undecaprenyl-phosphate galactose phosphotransferase WbaP [Pirellula sp.]
MSSTTREHRIRPRDGLLRSAMHLTDAADINVDDVFSGQQFHPPRDFAYLRQFFASSAPLWLADQFAIAAAFSSASFVAHQLFPGSELHWSSLLAILSVSSTFIFWLCGLYPAVGITADRELRMTSTATFLLFSVALIHVLINYFSYLTTIVLVLTAGASFVLTPFFRRTVRNAMAPFHWWSQPILIIGGGSSGRAVWQALGSMPECGLRPIGIVDELSRHWSGSEIDSDAYLGPCSEAPELVKSRNVFRGVVPLEDSGERDFAARVSQVAGLLPHVAITFADWPHLARNTAGDRPLVGIPAIQIDEKLLIPLQRAAKAVLDLIMLVVVGAIAFPLVAVLAILVYVTSPGPIFFSQGRVGKNGRIFRMWKLRTMVVNADEVLKQHLASDPKLREEWLKYDKLRCDPRITPFGKFLRKTSLDELPQIFNILIGDMSFIGPRPYPDYKRPELYRFAPIVMRVKPGITGLWQISGRSRSTFEERLKIDSGYIRDWSPWLDLYILSRTARVVLSGDGAC